MHPMEAEYKCTVTWTDGSKSEFNSPGDLIGYMLHTFHGPDDMERTVRNMRVKHSGLHFTLPSEATTHYMLGMTALSRALGMARTMSTPTEGNIIPFPSSIGEA